MALLSPIRFFETRANTNPHTLYARPRIETKKVRKGLVIEVNENYGRILCSRSFSDLGVFVFFDRTTVINGAPLNLVDLQQAVPLGAEVDFKLQYGFPSKWRTFSTYMGYHCVKLTVDVTKHIAMFTTELLAKETRQCGLVVATDGIGSETVLHPHIWHSPSTLRKLKDGAELEPKKHHRFQILTQPGRTLLAHVCPIPMFLKPKLRRLQYIALSAKPLSTTIVCYAHLVGVGPAELVPIESNNL